MVIDRTAASGEYCFKSGLGTMVHFATQPSPVAKQPGRFHLPAGLDANEARARKAGDFPSTRRKAIIRVAKG
jgi:hypothetical protein